ncbi:MAG: hypothetical protein KDD55_02920, partial [Bdellovibrionales bacterium]|nr:hypothetical protein [Bdellovibrionales bacterium]
VEAGKKAAAEILELQEKLLSALQGVPGAMDAHRLAQAIGSSEDELVYRLLSRLSENGKVRREVGSGHPVNDTFQIID